MDSNPQGPRGPEDFASSLSRHYRHSIQCVR